MTNFVGKRYTNGINMVEVTRQTNFGLTVEVVELGTEKRPVIQEYSWEKIVSSIFGKEMK